MSDDVIWNFWKEWEMATDKKKVLEKLAFKGIIKEGMEYSFYSTLNSYLEDFKMYLKREER